MFEHVHNIIIKGEHFTTRTQLNGILDKRINILFGRNGSGKSTIARALAELANPELPAENKAFQTIELDQNLTNDQRRAIHVFNEDFIEKYVKIEEDALGPIVMLGDQVEIAAQIVDKEAEIATLQNEFETLKAENDKLKDENERCSPSYCFKDLRAKLAVNGGWAERDSRCRPVALRRNSAVTEETINMLLSILDTNTLNDEQYAETKLNFDREYPLFCSSVGKEAIVFTDVTIKGALEIKMVQELLLRKVQKPELTEREQNLIALASNDLNRLETTNKLFSKAETEICPVCFRHISTEEKLDICSHIEHILNHEVEDYKAEVNRYLSQMSDLTYCYSALEHLFTNECRSVKSAMRDYNDVIGKCRQIVEKRIKNLFEVYAEDITVVGLEKSASDVNAAVANLKQVVLAYNKTINDRKKSAADLSNTNNILTAQKYGNELREYRIALNLLAQSNTKVQAKAQDLQKAKNELLVLQQSLEQTQLALDFINECLAYIYFSKSRLVLEEGDKCYRLKSNGIEVKPGHVSIGERNIIALCYYFANLFDHIKKEDQYKQEVLLVIDDPISSFDVENRMGVMSFLRWQIGKIYHGNANSRLLIMSHDLKTIYDFQKIVKELTGGDKKYNELINKQIVSRNPTYGNEYAWLFEATYQFSILVDPETADNLTTIGNIMRRLLEAFFTFNYQKAFYEFVCTEEFLNCLPDNKRTYYGNLMTRLVLNGGSHEEESIRSLSDLFALFTPQEMKVTAKSILSMIYLLNPLHVKRYLGTAALTEIENWQVERFDEIAI